jgi:hypothetical protein
VFICYFSFGTSAWIVASDSLWLLFSYSYSYSYS